MSSVFRNLIPPQKFQKSSVAFLMKCQPCCEKTDSTVHIYLATPLPIKIVYGLKTRKKAELVLLTFAFERVKKSFEIKEKAGKNWLVFELN